MIQKLNFFASSLFSNFCMWIIGESLNLSVDIQLECFGINWERPFKKKKVRKKTSKELNEIYKLRYNELEEVLNDDFFKQELYQRIYKLKKAIDEPEMEATEPTAINNPITGRRTHYR